MAKELPVACSLEAGDLEERLAEIADIGAESLANHEIRDGRHVLRFRSSVEIRRRLEEIVAAEAQCCGFLELSLRPDGEELVLSISAPESGQVTAAALAGAFEVSTSAMKPQRRRTRRR